MKLSIRYNHRLPPLAWGAEVDQTKGLVTAQCGGWVETGAEFFIEGAWAGDFLTAAFDQTEVMFGSGGVVRGGSIVFVSSVATTDYLYWRPLPKSSVAIANSLPLLLALTGDELNPKYDRYGAINRSILRGFRDHESEIPTLRGSVHRLMHENLRIDCTHVEAEPKPEPMPFHSFNDYWTYLDESCRGLMANARSEARRTPMVVVSTQSRGYDTTAVNAIAAKYELDRVYTIANAKPSGTFKTTNVEQANDDGTEICQILGLSNVVRLDRNEFVKAADAESLLYATLDDNEDANFFPIINRLPDRPSLLLTGTLGEIWYPERLYMQWRKPNSGAHLARWDLGTHGITELRLEKGFVQAAIVYLGARRRDDIFRISDSAEMARWHVPGDYDRPIPRRIAEEAGVPREAFGQRKMATVVGFPPPQIPWGAELANAYRSFLIRNRIITAVGWVLLPLIHAWNVCVIFTTPTRNRAFYYTGRILSRLGLADEVPKIGHAFNGRLFCFAVNRRVADYRTALESDQT